MLQLADIWSHSKSSDWIRPAANPFVRAALMTLLLNLQITTGYNLEDDRCECVALQDYKENEQVTRSSLWSLCLMSMYTRKPQI